MTNRTHSIFHGTTAIRGSDSMHNNATRSLLDDFDGLVDELSNEITRRLQRAVNDEYNTEEERSNDEY